jgi:hypothetical protein
VWDWHKDRHTDQQDETENPEINPHLYDYPIFDKVPTQQQGNKCLFNQPSLITGCLRSGHPIMHHMKNNSK